MIKLFEFDLNVLQFCICNAICIRCMWGDYRNSIESYSDDFIKLYRVYRLYRAI